MNPDKQSRQRKMFVAVLALALAGLAVDRLVLGGGATGPDEASADAPALESHTAATRATAPTTATTLTSRANTLAGRLDRIASTENFDLLEVDDAFRASPLWVKPLPQSAEVRSKEPADEAEAFAAKHRLMAVVNHGAGGAAIIGTQTVLVGRSIDGFTLVAVTKRSAVLEKGRLRVEISLPDPNPQQQKRDP